MSIASHTGVSRVFIWAQEPFTETIHANHSPRPFTQTIHRDHSPRLFTQYPCPNHSPRPFTQTIHRVHSPSPFTETLHRDLSPRPFTETLHRDPSQKPLHKLTITPLISQYPTHFPFSILSRILTQYPHYNPSLNLGSDPFIQTSG